MASNRPDALVDTSVAVPLVVADHPAHESVRQVVERRRLGLSGYASFESYSVLARLPPPARRAPSTVADLLLRRFPASQYLDAASTAELHGRLATLGIAGGAVNDALVGAAATHHGSVLLTRDVRATETYRLLGVEVDLIG